MQFTFPYVYLDSGRPTSSTNCALQLPNGLHFEWAMKTIEAGKHVLLEKPSCNTAAETRRIFEFAQEKGVVVLEAFHYRYILSVPVFAHSHGHSLQDSIQRFIDCEKSCRRNLAN